MQEKAASCPVRIWLNSTTLHNYPHPRWHFVSAMDISTRSYLPKHLDSPVHTHNSIAIGAAYEQGRYSVSAVICDGRCCVPIGAVTTMRIQHLLTARTLSGGITGDQYDCMHFQTKTDILPDDFLRMQVTDQYSAVAAFYAALS